MDSLEERSPFKEEGRLSKKGRLSKYEPFFIWFSGFILVFVVVTVGFFFIRIDPFLEDSEELPSTSFDPISSSILSSTEKTQNRSKELLEPNLLPNFQEWDSLFDQYFQDRYPVTKDNCNGQYITVTYNCPTAVGNRLMPVLNAFLIGVIFDSPIVFQWDDDGDIYWWGECELFIHHHDWLKLEYDVPCNLTERWAYLPSWKARDIAHNAQLTAKQKDRADLLFKYGEMKAFHKAFDMLFTFRNNVKKPVDEIVAKIPPSLMLIGIHMRHWKVHEHGYNKHLRKLILDQVLQICELEKCGIIIASDREMEIEFFKLDLKSANVDMEIFTTEKEVKMDKMHLEEHGNFTGLTAIQDLYLLSFAHHFIGTSASTFSKLASILAWEENSNQTFCSGLEDNPHCSSGPT